MSMSGGVGVISRERQSTFAGLNDFRQMDVGRVRTFWRTVERVPAGANIADHDGRKRQIVVVSGWISETRILPDGRRQIFAFLLPGDVATVNATSHVGSRGLVALTNVEIADAAALTAGEQGERVSASLVDAVRQREERLFDQIVRIGRLTAKERVLNLLLELYDRLDAIGLVKENTFRIPLTQEVFADALGLSVVHINRTLQQLRREGMLTVDRGTVTLHQRHKLASFACYQSESQQVERQPRRVGGYQQD
ncbi:MAG TPA: Crp/Fnr family transcriptional regulator [Phenylobacterium sp.]|uniref:Crp/Fnr family transcriptional regulator n=1 Tax=Phenylobacterium sp. TaxID=1871053 RepID=UPI002B476DFE|nr:Crp/Fnr family transcriptional regulator [Phenylobacterium sp.]HKR87896.1 Crp/Fnr family transcriptional regulator [Phenylobacterium sp.]